MLRCEHLIASTDGNFEAPSDEKIGTANDALVGGDQGAAFAILFRDVRIHIREVRSETQRYFFMVLTASMAYESGLKHLRYLLMNVGACCFSQKQCNLGFERLVG